MKLRNKEPERLNSELSDVTLVTACSSPAPEASPPFSAELPLRQTAFSFVLYATMPKLIDRKLLFPQVSEVIQALGSRRNLVQFATFQKCSFLLNSRHVP